MDQEHRQRLLDRFNALSRKERARIRHEALVLRDKVPRFPSRALRSEDDGAEPSRCRPKPDLETFVLQVLAREEPEGEEIGTVVGLALGRAIVESNGTLRTLGLSPKFVENSQEGGIAVGDRVTIAGDTVRTVLRRRTWLGRTDPDTGARRVIVANVDVVAIVVSVVAPPLHPRIVDRYVIGVGRGGAQPLVVVNKIDLGTEELALLAPYAAAGIPILPVSVGKGTGLAELKSRLQGKICAFVGHSGVGKSSLVNALDPAALQATGGVSEGYGRGTHTTTASSTFELGDGTRLIDTPGIREFGLGPLTRADLAWGFPEFAKHPCRLRGCTHDHEPNCGVKLALARGEVSEFRYATYRRLLSDVRPFEARAPAPQ